MKKIICLSLFLLSLILTPKVFAQGNSFVSVINPVRGEEFFTLQGQKPETTVFGQIEILKKFNLSATWLLRFDALNDQNVINALKNRNDEKGLFLEVTPTWTSEAKISYHKSESWHSAGSAFLTGYERDERKKLIDSVFDKFKNTFGYYPSSVGAWWIDAYSLGYMQEKYSISAALIVSDQYSTDNYQIWGQYFSTPYYPSKNNALHPAQTTENKLPVVMLQWAARDPVNAYGNGVYESTFSVQANDYMDYHKLDTSYFSKLLDIYTNQQFNKFGHLVVGLENSYHWEKYQNEYSKQIAELASRQNSNQLKVVLQKDFASWYKKTFPELSPEQIIVASDPLGALKKAVWFMDPYYRAGWFVNSEGEVFRDIRQYIDGEEELCFKTRCDSVNFATSATRVLDDVSFGQKWVIDEGRISDFSIKKQNDNYVISYKNAAGNIRSIEFLSRDIKVDDKISSIDGAILDAIKTEKTSQQKTVESTGGLIKWSIPSVLFKLIKFLLFLIFAIIAPGLILTGKLFGKDISILLRLFISSVIGLVVLTLLFYITSLLKIKPLIFVYILINFILFLRKYSSIRRLAERSYLKNINSFYGVFSLITRTIKQPFNLILMCVILVGTIFQVIPTFKSGLNFTYGTGFWGPNTHDGVWHIALINQLVKSVPPENPIYSGVILKNYHFFYDLLVAATNYLSRIPVVDLIFRFYPVIFSLMLGLGSYYLVMKLFENRMGESRAKVAAAFSLYFIYFAGSFGWIVEFLRERHFGGESAFWANQAVSFNLNPPFAVSLVILIALLHILFSNTKGIVSHAVVIIIVGTLASFKSYTGILVLGAYVFVAAVKILKNKDFTYLWIALFSLLVTALLFLSNFQASSALIIFAPFWFIHSMVDSPDRVGWVRLSLARTTSQTLGQWPKFIMAETLSLLFFIFGNLGLRFFSLGSLLRIKEVFKNDTLLFIFMMTIASIVIPILFIQSGNPWNTIQFFYPALYTTSLFAGLCMTSLIFKLNKALAIVFVGLVLVLAPINSIVTASGYLTNKPHAFVSSKELEGLQFMSQQPDGVVLTYPYDQKLKQKISEPWPLFVYDSTAYVSAFSEKSVYAEDEPQNQILLTDYKKRLVASKDFFLKPITESTKFLQDNQIKYVYLPKIYNVRLDENTRLVKNIFENEEVVIYEANF